MFKGSLVDFRLYSEEVKILVFRQNICQDSRTISRLWPSHPKFLCCMFNNLPVEIKSESCKIFNFKKWVRVHQQIRIRLFLWMVVSLFHLSISRPLKIRGKNTCYAGWVTQPTLSHYPRKPNDTCSFNLNI